MEQNKKSLADLLTFLQGHFIATLATVKPGGMPHGATVYFNNDEKGNFYFLSRDTTRKWKNIVENPHVSLVITDPNTSQTVQVEGTAEEVDYAKTYAGQVQNLIMHLEKNGKKWTDTPLQHQNAGYFMFVKVTPTWIRWSNYAEWKDIIQFEYTTQ